MKKLIVLVLFFIISLNLKDIYAKIDIENKKYKINVAKFIIDPYYKNKGKGKEFLIESIEIKKSELDYTVEQINNKTIKMNKIVEELEILNRYKRKLEADLRNYISLKQDLYGNTNDKDL